MIRIEVVFELSEAREAAPETTTTTEKQEEAAEGPQASQVIFCHPTLKFVEEEYASIIAIGIVNGFPNQQTKSTSSKPTFGLCLSF